ncbi:hypothetical protein [Clostridium isatidis]|uniref:Uncharacterized protein n=1 Tax=Clostridium isatidis TaxID=182773 RepID=A0A343JD74_9CLOT|nr:hypothetical protein [Clostridium isatidis]ASW43482.1 hypothetical protein BEN51_08310 [Clostridium isatidis]
MLQIQPIEFLLRGLPEGFIYILAVYVFSGTKLDKKRYVISALITAVFIYIIRLLPIVFGAHTVLSILFIMLLSINYNKINLAEAAKSTIITFILQYLSEAVNMLLIKFIPNLDIDKVFVDPVSKCLIGIPSLIITITIILLFYFYNKKVDARNV